VATAAPKKLINAAMPIQKGLLEAATGKSTYPDPLNPRPIRDRGEYLARMVDADPLYRAAKGIPQGGATRQLARAILHVTDPGEAAYNAARGTIHDKLEGMGVERGGGEPTSRSNALFYHRKAIAMGDKAAAAEWLEKYKELGGSDRGMEQSLERAHPLASVPVAKREAVVAAMSAAQKDKLKKAEEWYWKTYFGDEAPLARQSLTLRHELSALEAKADQERAEKRAVLTAAERKRMTSLRAVRRDELKQKKLAEDGKITAEEFRRRRSHIVQRGH
jgi:hypothetical protein